MTVSDIDPRDAIRQCDECGAVVSENDYAPRTIYECGNCSEAWDAEDGRSCPTCHKFGSKKTDDGCSECFGTMEAGMAFWCELHDHVDAFKSCQECHVFGLLEEHYPDLEPEKRLPPSVQRDLATLRAQVMILQAELASSRPGVIHGKDMPEDGPWKIYQHLSWNRDELLPVEDTLRIGNRTTYVDVMIVQGDRIELRSGGRAFHELVVLPRSSNSVYVVVPQKTYI